MLARSAKSFHLPGLPLVSFWASADLILHKLYGHIFVLETKT